MLKCIYWNAIANGYVCVCVCLYLPRLEKNNFKDKNLEDGSQLK